jgi:hypothetical protein
VYVLMHILYPCVLFIFMFYDQELRLLLKKKCKKDIYLN